MPNRPPPKAQSHDPPPSKNGGHSHPPPSRHPRYTPFRVEVCPTTATLETDPHPSVRSMDPTAPSIQERQVSVPNEGPPGPSPRQPREAAPDGWSRLMRNAGLPVGTAAGFTGSASAVREVQRSRPLKILELCAVFQFFLVRKGKADRPEIPLSCAQGNSRPDRGHPPRYSSSNSASEDGSGS